MSLKRLSKHLRRRPLPAVVAPELVPVRVELVDLHVLERLAAAYGLSADDFAAHLLADALAALDSSALVDDLEQRHYVNLRRKLRLIEMRLDAMRQLWQADAVFNASREL